MYRVIYRCTLRPCGEPALDQLVQCWASIMKSAPGFIAISLFRGLDGEGRYCAISDWESEAKYLAFFQGPDHEQVAAASAELFSTDQREAYNLVYQVTLRGEE